MKGGENFMPEEKKETPTQSTQETPKPKGETKPPEPKVLFYILSFLIGLFGIIFGIIYMTKEGEENKKFGKICLILGLLPMILACICWLLMFILGIGSSFLGGGGETTTY